MSARWMALVAGAGAIIAAAFFLKERDPKSGASVDLPKNGHEPTAVVASPSDEPANASNPPFPAQAVQRLLEEIRRLPDGEAKEALSAKLAAIRDPAAVPILLDALTNSEDLSVARASGDALRHLADEDVVWEIAARYDAADNDLAQDRFKEVVAGIENPAAIEGLIELWQAKHPLALAGIRALASIGTAPATSYLIDQLDTATGDDADKLGAIIPRITRPAALPALEYAALGNKEAASDRARAAAILALGNYPGDESIQLASRLVTDESRVIRLAAEQTLARLRRGLAVSD